MIQTRLFLTTEKDKAKHVYHLLEEEFEEDGFPLVISEVDEERQIFEVSLYVEGNINELETRVNNKISAHMSEFNIEREELPDIDWVSHSLDRFKPVCVGRFFVHGSHDRDKHRAYDLAIEIDATRAFGTGHHGTTAGCLDMISKVLRHHYPRNALDLGTGSAVLAIALTKLTPIPVLATDIDPMAIVIAKENVIKNNVSPRITTVTAAGFHHSLIRNKAPFDLIVANILARPLMQFASEMRRYLAPGGSLILSGILERQRNKVLSAYRTQGIYHQRTLHREGWVILHQKLKNGK